MSIVYAFLIGLSLSMDAFSVCVSAGACRRDSCFYVALRMSSIFGFFQFAMPIFGYFLGCYALRKFSPYDEWIASFILFFVGLKMAIDSRKAQQCDSKDFTKGVALLALAIATSIDALSVGVGVAVTNVSIVFLSSIIGIVTMGMCLLGVYFGHTLGLLFGRFACIFSGLVVCAIGLKILLL